MRRALLLLAVVLSLPATALATPIVSYTLTVVGTDGLVVHGRFSVSLIADAPTPYDKPIPGFNAYLSGVQINDQELPLEIRQGASQLGPILWTTGGVPSGADAYHNAFAFNGTGLEGQYAQVFDCRIDNCAIFSLIVTNTGALTMRVFLSDQDNSPPSGNYTRTWLGTGTIEQVGQAVPVPEPSSLVLMATGAAFLARRRRRAASGAAPA